MKDSEVLTRIHKGDEEALDFLYKKYYRMMTKLVITNSGSEEKAKDVVQETFTKMWVKHKDVEAAKAKSYLFTTGYHTMIDMIRKDKVRRARVRPSLPVSGTWPILFFWIAAYPVTARVNTISSVPTRSVR